MVFSSMVFLWCFLPIVLLGYYIIGRLSWENESVKMTAKNVWLFLASLFFYAWGGVYYLGILCGITVIDYTSGRVLEKCDEYRKKSVLVITISLNLLILFVFKYANMLASVLEAKNWSEIALPIGISFFTFQAMSYVIDVYRGEVETLKKFLDFSLYVVFFPQLVAGPIVKFKDIRSQLRGRKESLDMFSEGVKRFCYGLGKKVLLANSCAEIADKIFDGDVASMGASVAWLGILAYTLQIYYDFSGYSDMAIGLGRMFGFSFAENFNYPYMALSIRDFWRRWHMSLSGWFRDYVYIPLGGNRKGLPRTCLNIFIVFLLTGIWHGAEYSFFLWGFIYGIILVAERLGLGKLLEKNRVKPINYIYTMLVVSLCWVLFRADSIGAACLYYSRLFSKGNSSLIPESFLSMKGILAIAFGIILMGPAQAIYGRYFSDKVSEKSVLLLNVICEIGILAASLLLLVGSTYNPFIYFMF